MLPQDSSHASFLSCLRELHPFTALTCWMCDLFIIVHMRKDPTHQCLCVQSMASSMTPCSSRTVWNKNQSSVKTSNQCSVEAVEEGATNEKEETLPRGNPETLNRADIALARCHLGLFTEKLKLYLFRLFFLMHSSVVTFIYTCTHLL